MNIIKRDGAEVLFDRQKIVDAIEKAYSDVYTTISEKDSYKIQKIARDIENLFHLNARTPYVEEIQDIVEAKLMGIDKEVARAYIRYRYKKEIAREAKDDFIDAIREKLDGKNIQNQNANVDEHTFGGRTGEASHVVTKKFALDYICSSMARKNHINNRIYIHDLDSMYVGSHNCLTIPFDKLLANGFKTRQTDVRPAGSINTALQLIAVIFQLQSLDQFGGVAASHLDWTLVPYVRKSFAKHFIDGLKYCEKMLVPTMKRQDIEEWSIEDERYKQYFKAYDYAMDMTRRELDQAVEGLYHNLNTLQSRSGN